MKQLTTMEAQKLAAQLHFRRPAQLFDYIAESVINGQRKQANELYRLLHVREERLQCLRQLSDLPPADYADILASLSY